ncbi:hypothetical protein SARC_06575 [Sphaeroforma arctica JP610]|uniref:pyruvate, water dikinase n=1 Tax=Sphaeroforma arctica JP610 TaxID=667725 RepID=A0A0L0FWU7_9EUKA|nr:hypothetical protein SARC_06575 [Sphaeroforma arctica JP610]KNC81094.1 hypothetical protein SARC_06575 [Sphaeroforma arctica JP610]|eukprot:XP_014154996.1 hypothetical protein SARC_06575 [Sphaeroforma arctica JP610]
MTEGKIDNLYSLNDGQEPPPTQWIGGKAAGLMNLCTTEQLKRHVPRGFAVSEAFFQTWMNEVLASNEYKAATDQNSGVLSTKAETGHSSESDAQQLARSGGGCAFVCTRGGCDGASFAGVFVTKLGVSVDHVELALRGCFASVFDQKVSQYGHTGWHPTNFSAVVMEMVEPSKAGVAFSANPLNSDLDEMVVNSSWGLGESVVDGSIMADRFIWDKLGSVVLETKIGNKERERRVCPSGGGVEELQVSEQRAGQGVYVLVGL